jgi:mono/diheme cytochrome c family protein
MRRLRFDARSLALPLAAILLAPAVLQAEPDPQEFALIERGRYLTVAADCASCHTVPGNGRPFAGGRAIETPFGSLIAPNITPDRETGIGAWSDDEFDAAVRKGIRRNGSRLYPAMPYNAYTRMSRNDVLAIRAYLNTVTPIRNAVVANTLPFPFNVRPVMGVWDALYFTNGEYKPDSGKSAAWNRGAYLVNGPGHCGACHTPKTTLGGDTTAEFFRGGELQGWFAPNITNDAARGLGRWSSDDVVAYLKTGHNRISAATGPMAEVVSLSSSQLTDADLKAIATYLKSLAQVSDPPKALRPDDPAMVAGGAIYRDQCSACHALDGRGTPQLFPSVAESSVVQSASAETLIRLVLRGARSVATDSEPTASGMPSYGWQLDDAQVAAVLTYLRNNWGAAAEEVSPAEVSAVRARLASRTD